MSTPKIKFCGLTRIEDVDAAVRLGVDYIGLVLAAGSPRCIALETAALLARATRSQPDAPQIVLLFRNAESTFIRQAIDRIAPDILQFHGSESATFCEGFEWPYWKAIGMMGSSIGPDEIGLVHPKAAALLLDGHVQGASGGTGERFDWSRWPSTSRPLVLAGGLNPLNVAAAVHLTRPFAVDVSSGIESAPGIKAPTLMRSFVEAVR